MKAPSIKALKEEVEDHTIQKKYSGGKLKRIRKIMSEL